MRFQTILDKKAGFESIPLETRKPTRGQDDFGGLENHETERNQGSLRIISWQGQ
jgi:hypothetical protein